MKTSFCVTCRGRLDQLWKTLPASILENIHDSRLEFVLVDYNSKDGLEGWVRDRMMAYIESGRLLYAKLDDAEYYNSPHAKNLAHRLATGDILVNLDADTWMPSRLSHLIKGVVKDGTFMRCKMPSTGGLIAMARRDFFRLGGYDERLGDGYGFDDDSLSHRAEAAGVKPVSVPDELCGCIQHGDDRRVECMADKDISATARENAGFTHLCLAMGGFVANVGRSIGASVVTVNFKKRVYLT